MDHELLEAALDDVGEGTRLVMIPSVFRLSSLSMEMAHKGSAMLDHYLASKWPSAVPPRPQVRRGPSAASPSTSTARASSVPPCGISPMWDLTHEEPANNRARRRARC